MKPFGGKRTEPVNPGQRIQDRSARFIASVSLIFRWSLESDVATRLTLELSSSSRVRRRKRRSEVLAYSIFGWRYVRGSFSNRLVRRYKNGVRRIFSVPVCNDSSGLFPTRLETRTKESNVCASHGVSPTFIYKWSALYKRNPKKA